MTETSMTVLSDAELDVVAAGLLNFNIPIGSPAVGGQSSGQVNTNFLAAFAAAGGGQNQNQNVNSGYQSGVIVAQG